VSTDTQENVSSLICKNGTQENASATRDQLGKAERERCWHERTDIGNGLRDA
jgi:hypothetical protein